MTAGLPHHFTLWDIGSQPLELAFDQGPIVSDAGLLAVRALDRSLGVLQGLAQRLPDPRSRKFVTHSAEALLTQQVYQLLAGYPDCNDADTLRHDPLFQILAEVAPDPQRPLASGSTLARFQYAYTRRQAELPREQRPVLLEQRAAQTQRLKVLNDYLLELFIRTRRTPPAEVILDLDATDDPVHGSQTLAGYHGYYGQHQYLPLLVFEGRSGFPLAAWLRPGTVHGACGAVEILQAIVSKLRQAWPGVVIKVRGDTAMAVPRLYDYCEAHDLRYAFGFARNAVLERATEQALADVELYYAFYGRRDPHVQRFEEVRGYQAEGWSRPRRVLCKVERTPQGSQRRFLVSNLDEPPETVYRGFYVQRGAVPEQPIGELKNGLRAERLSASGFCANSFRLLLHVVAYALVVLFREAASGLPEVATATVSTLRHRLWKAGAVVVVTARRVLLRLSAHWPGRELWGQAVAAVAAFVAGLREGVAAAASQAEGAAM
jgi:Transposase DDE domain group 1